MRKGSDEKTMPQTDEALVNKIIDQTLALDDDAMLKIADKYLSVLRSFSKPIVTGQENIPTTPPRYL